MITIAGAVVAAFIAIGIISHRNSQTPPHSGQPPTVATLPNQ